MAVPAYTEDLTDIDLAEVGSTGVGINFGGGGGGAPAFGADLGMQGGGAWDRAVSNDERGIVFNQTPGSPVIAAGIHVYAWLFVAAPGITASFNARGAYIIMGTATNALVQFHVEGNNTYGAAGRVGKCYPIRYNENAATNLRTLTGTPGTTPTYFGAGMTTTATAKGSPLGVDALRYGTGAYLTAGELISAGDGSDDPCTFAGFNTQNDSINNRWGILTSIGGSYELQGIFAMGQNNSGTATLIRFKANDVNIIIPDALHCTATFNQFIFDHASSRIEWTNVNITSSCVLSPGSIEVTSNDPDVFITGGTYSALGLTTLQVSTTVLNATWRNCDQIIQNGATMTGCFIETGITSPMLDADIANGTVNDVTGCSFVGDGTANPGHAVDLGTITATQTLNWDNTLDDGSGSNTDWGGSAGTTVGVSGDADDAILVNVASGQTLTLATTVASTIPSVRNTGPGTVTITANTVTVQVEVRDDDTGSLLELAHVLLLKTSDYSTQVLNGATAAAGIVEDTAYAYSGDEDVEGWVRQVDNIGTDYEPVNIAGTIKSGGLFLKARLKPSS